MKRNKLLSVLLSAAMVCQMGVVVGFGAEVTKCDLTNHETSKCVGNFHWLKGSAGVILYGVDAENGINFFTVTGGEIIQCAQNAKDVIIATTIPEEVTISGFDAAQDQILIKGIENEKNNESISVEESAVKRIVGDREETIFTFSEGTASTDWLEELTKAPGPLSFDLSAKNEVPIHTTGETVTASASISSAVGNLTYIWQKSINGGTTWEPLNLNETDNTCPVDTEKATNDTYKLKYKCIIVDDIGQRGEKDAAVTITECAKEANAVTVAITNGVAPTAAIDADTALTLGYTIGFDDGNCNVKSHAAAGSTHDKVHTVDWTLKEAVNGVKLSGNKVTVTAADLDETEKEVTVIATLKQDGKADITGELTFKVKGNPQPECHAVPTLSGPAVDGQNLEGGKASVSLKENETKTLSFSAALAAKTDDTHTCTIDGHDASNHGYSVKWETETKGVKISNDNTSIELTASEFAEGENTVTLTPVLYKDGSPVTEGEAAFTQSYTFTVTVTKEAKKECAAVPKLSNVAINGQKTEAISIEIKEETTTVTGTADLSVTTDADHACNLEEHKADPNHGYTTVWTFTPEGGTPVTMENGVLTVKKSDVPAEGSKKGTITVTARKADETGGEVSVTRQITFQRAAEPPKEDDTGNTGGNQGNTGDNQGNTGGNQGATDPKPEETKPTIEIKPVPDKPNSAPEAIKISKETKELSFQYNVPLTAEEAKQYTVRWTLAKKSDGSTSDYITVTPEANPATVAIIREKLPPAGVNNEVFILTAQLWAKTPAKAKARTAAANTNSEGPVAEKKSEITVTAEAGANEETCDAKPTKVTVSVVPSAEIKAVNDTETVTATAAVEWDKTDCTQKQHTSHQKITWAVEPAGEGVTVGDDGKLTITKADLPKMENEYKITATVASTVGTKPSATGETTLKVTRGPMKCDWKITAIRQEPTAITASQSGAVTLTNNNVTVKYTLDPAALTETGKDTCEFGGAAHDQSKNHTISWKAEKPENSNLVLDNAVKLKPVEGYPNEMNVEFVGTAFPAGQTTTVYLKAYVAGNEAVNASVKIEVTRNPVHTGGSSDRDDDDSDDREWESIEDKIDSARNGSTVKIKLGSNTEMPFYIFDALRGENITLEMSVDGGYTWSLNGKTVKKLPAWQIYVPLDVEKYSNTKMLRLCRDLDIKSFKLRHEGSFYGDMKLTMNLGSSYAKKTVFLYSYDEDKNKLTYTSSARVDEDGDVTFVMTKSLGNYVITSKALYGESPVSGGGGVVGSGSSPSTVYRPTAPVTSNPPAASGSSSGSGSSGSSGSSSSSSSESSSSSSSVSEPPPPASPSQPAEPADTDAKPEKQGMPILVPVLILAIAGVITATVLVVRSNKGKDEEEFDD